MARYNIGGYIFEDENKAKKAAKELKTVEYILGQVKDSDENGVLKVYKKLLNQRLFSTEIGMSFWAQLRQNLLASGVFTEDEVPEVYSLEKEQEPEIVPEPVVEPKETVKAALKTKEVKPKVKKVKVKTSEDIFEVKRLKFINKILLILCATLLLCVVGMFYVNSTINSPTILNYEEKILDKYSAWEQELTAREAAVKEKELNQK